MKKHNDDMLFFLIPALFVAWYLFNKDKLSLKDFEKIFNKISDVSIEYLLKDEKKQESILKEANKILKGKKI